MSYEKFEKSSVILAAEGFDKDTAEAKELGKYRDELEDLIF